MLGKMFVLFYFVNLRNQPKYLNLMSNKYSIEITPKYSESELEKFENEDLFMDAYVELLKQSIELLYHIVNYKYCDENGEPIIINKDSAVIGGNLIRFIKLNTSFLQNICEGKVEICYILNRCIAETYINIKYMLVESEDRVKRNFIKHSLRTEKELWEIIIKNIKDRGDDTLPIENRMQISIQNSFDKSDFPIDDVNKSSKWKSIKNRADEVAGDYFYNIFYGISSHSIHGNWQDILSNNLIKLENGYKLDLNWQHPKPQLIDPTIFFNLDTVEVFLEKELANHEYNIQVKKAVNKLQNYLALLLQKHEQWLSNMKIR